MSNEIIERSSELIVLTNKAIALSSEERMRVDECCLGVEDVAKDFNMVTCSPNRIEIDF